MLIKVATWIAGAIAFGWLATAASVAFRGGHPPMFYVVGMGVVILSFVIAPIGAAAAVAELWRARHGEAGTSRLAVIALAMNLVFLAVAIGVWFWMDWLARRR
jgi:hypothetical protein